MKKQFKMPEIIIEHESWGKKLLRAFTPSKSRLWMCLFWAVVCAVCLHFGWARNWEWFVITPVVFYLLESILSFVVMVIQTKRTRKTEQAVISALKELEKQNQRK